MGNVLNVFTCPSALEDAGILTFIQNGTIDPLDCRKDYLDATLETFIKQEVKYRAKVDSR